MESLSRPFHSRKLSNPYDAVFAGHRRKFAGASAIDVQDYSEMFGSCQTCSIPVLDLSQPSDALTFNFGDLKPDYSKIFGGLRDEDVAVSYEELFSHDKPRAPSSTAPTSQDLDNESPLKQFHMSYNKINKKSKDGFDVTKITQVPALTGFTCFIDEPVMEAKKQNPSAVNGKSSRNAVRKDSNPVESISEDKKARTFGVDFKRSVTNLVDHTDDAKRSVKLESRRAALDEEIDVHSDASAALKKAIEKAQESIRIARESVGRKKNGLRSFSSKKFKKSLKVEGEEEKCIEEDSSKNVQDVGRDRKYGGTAVVPNFMESEKLFVAKKFIDEIHEKISESVKDSKFGDGVVAHNVAQVNRETEVKSRDSAQNDEHTTLCSEAVDTETSKIQTSGAVHECQTDNKIIDEYEARIEVSKPTVDFLEHKTDVKELESEENRLDASLELLENAKQENILERDEVVYAESEKHEAIEEASELVESEDGSEDDQTSEIHTNKDTTSEMFDGFCEIDAEDSGQTCDNKLEESEVNLRDDGEVKQEDNHTLERQGESSDESCDQECDEKSLGDDNVVEETNDIDSVHVASNNVEMNDVKGETSQEFCDKTFIDRIASDNNEDEYEVKSEESNVTDNLADLGLDNDVRSESSSGTPNTESTNEIKGSQEPESRDKEDDVEEPGPSKVSAKDRFKRIDEEAAAKEREWEKNRLAVERAIREARERAFAEARERAERERAAVEKATEEVRQRMMAEAHEKVSKASVTSESSDKTSAQSRIRAERAAVERATSEARQRALEKAISQKTASDLNRSETALRTKAKLEKHNRIMERAANALAEKEKRDRLAQKEQAERNRLAENLDADIKRWSNGKEGNLRALLSTLQYILGPESGWQPVTLTEIVSTSAVKKAYRKATLCVHPDKLQQRGATVQQKYKCEKVFDLLKAAWNRFNSEER